MKINKVLEVDGKLIKIEGELGEEETNLVVEIGLNYLLRNGAFPSASAALEAAAKVEEALMGYEEAEEKGQIQ